MARKRKDREVSIVHFSFFDLLFGAFGAFVFLMIMQVLSTLNLVDVDIQKLVDDTVQEKTALTKELEKYKEKDQVLVNLQQQYTQIENDREKLLQEKAQFSEKTGNLETKVSSLERELVSLRRFKETAGKKGDMLKALEEENKKLGSSLDRAQRKLGAIKTTPLKIKTKSFPTTITDENVYLALAAEGGSLPYTWGLDGRLPRGLSFNKSTGTISGVVKSAGDYGFKLKVTDAKGLSVKSKTDIPFKVIKKYEEPKSKISQWFLFGVIMAVVFGFYSLYLKRQKTKAKKEWDRIVREAKARGDSVIGIPIR